MRSRTRDTELLALAIAVLFAIQGHQVIAQSTSKDSIVGNWKLDVGKSTFAGARPTKRMMMFAAVPNGMKQTITTTTTGAAEVTYNLVYTAKFDGKDYPADVASSFNTVSMKRTDARTLERIGKVHGQVTETETYVVSPDGQKMTVTQQGSNNGVPFNTSQVYTRE